MPATSTPRLARFRQSDETKKIPYLGDWDMLRSQTFLGEMKKDCVLFGSPMMKTMRRALRKHVDVTHTARDMAEVLLAWLARCEAWAQQVDEYFEYKAFDKKLTLAQNKKRFADYMRLQDTLRTASASIIEQILNCLGVGKDSLSVLAQLMVASQMQGQASDRAYETILAGLSGVETLDGRAAGDGGGHGSNGQPQDPSENSTLKLLVASFADKAVTYKMPQPVALSSLNFLTFAVGQHALHRPPDPLARCCLLFLVGHAVDLQA